MPRPDLNSNRPQRDDLYSILNTLMLLYLLNWDLNWNFKKAPLTANELMIISTFWLPKNTEIVIAWKIVKADRCIWRSDNEDHILKIKAL